MGPIPGKVQNGWRLFQNGVWTSGPTLLLLAGYPYPGEAQLLTIVVLQEGRATLAYNGHGEIDELWNRPLRMRGGRFFAGVCEDMVRQRTARFGPYPLMPGGLSDRDGDDADCRF